MHRTKTSLWMKNLLLSITLAFVFLPLSAGFGEVSEGVPIEKDVYLQGPAGPTLDEGALSDAVTFAIYDSEDGSVPVATQTFVSGEYNLEDVSEIEGLPAGFIVRVRAAFTEKLDLVGDTGVAVRPKVLWAEIQVGGEAVGARHLLAQDIMERLLAGSDAAAVPPGETENLIASYETGDKEFERYEIGDYISYWHQRMLGSAIVEKDYINYIFERKKDLSSNGSNEEAGYELIEKREHWRKDLPEEITLAGELPISQEEAMASVEELFGGEALFATLYIISPDSDVFPIEPTPTNPCWVVRSVVNERQTVSIIDAETGEYLGPGIPPPYESFSLTGPTDQYYPCSGGWNDWYLGARNWFNTMGYPCEAISWPSKATIQTHAIKNRSEVLFYELAHGGSTSFFNACDTRTYASDIKNWIASYRKFPFTFIGSCGGMCSTGPGNFSYEFRKGSNLSTTVVGYCGMGDSKCSSCWGVSRQWQTRLFTRMNQGWSVKSAFNNAMAAYPVCAGTNNCMRFSGDTYFRLKNRDEILGAGGSWSAGLWYYNFSREQWSKPFYATPDKTGIPIAVGDVTGDGKADMVSVWKSGLWYQNGATLGWTRVSSIPPGRITVGDTTGDGYAEIIGTWGNGIWWRNVRYNSWYRMYELVPSGAIAAGDITGDGKADVASIWGGGLWYQNGATLGWTKVYSIPPGRITVGDTTGDGYAEIIGTWGDGIWWRNVRYNSWYRMYGYVPSGAIAAGDITGDGRADVASIWGNSLWYQSSRTLGWTWFYKKAPGNIALGNISGN